MSLTAGTSMISTPDPLGSHRISAHPSRIQLSISPQTLPIQRKSNSLEHFKIKSWISMRSRSFKISLELGSFLLAFPTFTIFTFTFDLDFY
jgi:hypothetical protein